jgi:hypothetical protein
MSTTAALTLLDGIDRDHPVCGLILRTQVAFVRALVDEIDRRHGSRAMVAALNDQLLEESDRLTQMLGSEVLGRADRAAWTGAGVRTGVDEAAKKKAEAALDGPEGDELREAELATRATQPGNEAGPSNPEHPGTDSSTPALQPGT